MSPGNERTVPPMHRLRGQVTVPGDKSISHRALILGALVYGTTRVSGWLRSADVRSTRACLEALGVEMAEQDGDLLVHGRGGRFAPPAEVLDAGNSGTTCRILAGALAGAGVRVTIDGDASLRRRPMGRIARPLGKMGCRVETRDGCLPMTLVPPENGQLAGILHHPEVASAQVKSCVLLAGLRAAGETTVVEPGHSRDHTERMLPAFGAEVITSGLKVRIAGGQQLQATDVAVPGDFSSAAFLLAAGLLVPDAELEVQGVGLNPTRTGLLAAIEAMGAGVRIEPEDAEAAEPRGNLWVQSARLQGTRLDGRLILEAIDEVPLLAVLATAASGETVIADAGELRVKESDRLAAIAAGLQAMGAAVEEQPDGLRIAGGTPLKGATVDARGDHRIAMALAVAALTAEGATTIRGADAIDVSFPGFFQLLDSLRAS